MSNRARINGFTAWVNVRLGNPETSLGDVLVDLMTGTNMKQLIEGFTGSNFERLQSYDGLSQTQKVQRAEWILKELIKWKIFPSDTKMDAPKFAARNADQIFNFLWILVCRDIWFVWDIMDFLQNPDLGVVTKIPFTWIPQPPPEAPKKQFKEKKSLLGGFGASSVKYEEIPPEPGQPHYLDNYKPFPFLDQMRMYKKKIMPDPDRKPKPMKCILEMVQNHLKMTRDGRKLSVKSLDCLCDIRVLCALFNSFLSNSFTHHVLMNDRWSINLVLRCFDDVFRMTSTFDSEDLVEADMKGTCTYFCFFFMAGYKFRQAKCVTDYHEQLRLCLRDCKVDKEQLGAAGWLTPLQKDEMYKIDKEIDRLNAEMTSLTDRFDLQKCKLWMDQARLVLAKTHNTIKNKMEERYELVPAPRSITIGGLCVSLVINLSLTGGSGFYLLTAKEELPEDRRLILYLKKDKIFIDDTTAKKQTPPTTIRKLLKIPEEATVELNPEDHPAYDIYIEAASRNKYLSVNEPLLYQVFPSSLKVWQKALLKAAKEGDMNTAENLIRFFRHLSPPGLVNCKESPGNNRPLHLAARHGQFKMALFLLESGANVDAKNTYRYPPLTSAIEGGHRDICHLLIEWGCDVHIKSIKGTTPIEACVNNSLKDFMTDQYQFYSTTIPKIMKEDVDLLTSMVRDHRSGSRPLADLRSRSINGSTVLHTAAFFGAEQLVKELVRMRLDVNLKDYKGASPLHRSKNAAIMRTLLDFGADLLAEDLDGNQALHVKCYGETGQPSDLAAITMLLKEGAKLVAGNSRGLLPIHCASMQGRIDVIQLLLDYDKEGLISQSLASEPDDVPPSLIHLALANDSAECATWLLEMGYALKPGEADHLLQRIVTAQLKLSNRLAVSEFLLARAGADANTRYLDTGNTPLHFATGLADAGQLIVLLVDFGADVDAANLDHCTPLFAACQANNMIAASVLIELGSNVRAKNNQGLTALDYIPDFAEWIDSGYFDTDMVARMKAYKLKHTRDLVRAITKKVKPFSASGANNVLESLNSSLTLALNPRPQSQAYFLPPSPLPIKPGTLLIE